MHCCVCVCVCVCVRVCVAYSGKANYQFKMRVESVRLEPVVGNWPVTHSIVEGSALCWLTMCYTNHRCVTMATQLLCVSDVIRPVKTVLIARHQGRHLLCV